MREPLAAPDGHRGAGGETPLPGGDVFPLVYDAAVAASLANGIREDLLIQ
jgi:hypothetical protein